MINKQKNNNKIIPLMSFASENCAYDLVTRLLYRHDSWSCSFLGIGCSMYVIFEIKIRTLALFGESVHFYLFIVLNLMFIFCFSI